MAGFPRVLSLARLNGSNGFRIDGIGEGDHSGTSVSDAGDVNGDGFDDLIIGAPSANPTVFTPGESYIIFGAASGFAAIFELASVDGSNGFRLPGIDQIDSSGVSVSGAGDVNGDGFDDVIIGASNALTGAGASYVVFGAVSGFSASFDLAALDGSNGFRLAGIDRFDSSGRSVSGAGDVNGDGFDDLIIGARYADPGDQLAGESYVVFGAASGFSAGLNLASLDGSNGFRLDGIDPGDKSGGSVSGAGDFNGDGFDDVIVGANSASPNGANYAGESYVVFGAASGFSASLDLANLDGSNGFRLDGTDLRDFSGWSVSGAGDVNSDGFDDLIIGAPFAGPNSDRSTGESYVVFGAASGFSASFDLASLDGSNGFRLRGVDPGDQSGRSVSGAGDVNGDGFDDVIIGAPSAEAVRDEYAGKSYVVFGAASGFSASVDLASLDGSNGFRLDGFDPGDHSGGSVSGAGDVNGDGVDDLIIGARDADHDRNSGQGEGYVVFGRDAVASVVAAEQTIVYVENQRAGSVLGTVDASDFIGVTGFAIVGGNDGRWFAIAADGSLTLTVAGAAAAANDFETAPNISTLAVAARDAAGNVSAATDVTLRLADVPDAADDAFTTTSNAPISGNLFADNGFEPDPTGFLQVALVNGASVAVGETIILPSGALLTIGADGAFTYDPNGAVSGGSDTFTYAASLIPDAILLASLDGSNGFRLDGIDPYDSSGFSVSGAGDVNGDGFDDVIIAAVGDPNDDPYAGESYVVFGAASGFSASLDLASLDGSNGFRLKGSGSVSDAGDVNGDGFDDLIVGTASADPNGGSDAGESYVVFGAAASFSASFDLADLDGSNGFRLKGIDPGDRSGSPVSYAGDVNGDGFDDLIIGARYADPNGDTDAGESYVVFGAAAGFSASFDLAGLDGSNGFRLDGIDPGDRSGSPVSSAGDVNGDGLDDLIIGARGADPNGDTDAGESYVVFGAASGFSASLDLASLDGSNGFRLDGINPRDNSGYSVSGAGDVNGDGFDDLLVGQLFGRRGGSPGETYVVFGAASGISASLDLGDLDGSNGFRLDGIDPYDSSGLSVSGAGDVNGDGFDDLIIGAPGAAPVDEYNSPGESYVVFGRPNLGEPGTVTITVSGEGASNGRDTLLGTGADDSLNGRGGDDLVKGSNGDDLLQGSTGDDTLNGGTGADTLNGGADGDRLFGGLGDDALFGSAGDDVLSGGAGDDVLRGGSGPDRFTISSASGPGRDVIADFDDGNEFVKLSNLSVTDVTDNGTNATVTLDNGGEIIFRNLLADDISEADFLFVGSGGFLA